MRKDELAFYRRDFGKIAAAGLPPASPLAAKPDARCGGVRLGAISYSFYSFREMPDGNDAEAIPDHTVELRLSGIEGMNGPAEA